MMRRLFLSILILIASTSNAVAFDYVRFIVAPDPFSGTKGINEIVNFDQDGHLYASKHYKNYYIMKVIEN